MEIYLDNSATTRCFPEVADLIHQILCEDYGNPSSMHHKGVEAESYVRDAKETLAKILKVNEKEILFTSGGTESDNIAIMGVAMANHRAGRHMITTKVEHPAILQTMKYMESQDFEVTYLDVDEKGRISLEQLEQAIRPDTILVSIMHTNNEIGTLQPIAQAGALIKRCNPNTLFHVDAVQGFGKARIYPKKMKVDLMSVSAHKIHGPKGVGFLYIGEKVKIKPIMYGGGQQEGMRSGTENVPGYAGMAKAAQMLYEQLEAETDYLYDLRQYFIEQVEKIDGAFVNGAPGREGAPHIVSVTIPGVRAQVLLNELSAKYHICVSAGSACSTHKPQPSATLLAIGLDKEQAVETLRFSFSVFTTRQEIDTCLDALYSIVPEQRKARHY
mgnify:FL=1